MKNTFNANMFESIKSALENAKNKQGGDSNYKNILSIAAPATYVVRLLPNIKNPENTFLHYYHHGWNSTSTGKYFSIVSPSTWGDRCPVSELYFKTLRDESLSETEKNRAKESLKRKENWMVNVYVVNDPKNPENNGTIKVLRYGRQLNKIIEAAINGDDSSEFGAKIFDLGPDGCNLRIKAELVSDKPGAPKYPTYTASKFLSPSAIENLDEDKIPEIYNSIFDLQAFVEHKTAEEIKGLIDTHYYNKEQGQATETAKPDPVSTEEEDVPYEDVKPTPKVAAKPVTPAPKVAVKNEAITTNDDKVMAILNGLDNM